MSKKPRTAPAPADVAVEPSVSERLAVLYSKYGRLTPGLVVDDASSPDSPLHSHFEWDDSIAAQRHREDQARSLIRSVQIVLRTETTQVKCVAYVRDPNAAAKEPGYVSVDSLRNDDLAARRALTFECDRVAASLERARHVALGLGLVGEVDALMASLAKLREQAAA